MSDTYDYSQYVDFSPYANGAAPDPNTDPNFAALMSMLMPGMGQIPQYEVQGKPGGGQLPYDIGTQNQVNTAYYHDMQNIFDPSLAMMGMAYGLPTGDPTQFVDQTPAIPEPSKITPNLDALMKDYPAIGQAIAAGSSIPHVGTLVRNMGLDDSETQDVIDAAKQAQKEQADYARALSDHQSKVAQQKPQQTAMQKFAAQAGLPDPLATYTPDDIQGDFNDSHRGDEAQKLAARAAQQALEAHTSGMAAYKKVQPAMAATTLALALKKAASQPKPESQNKEYPSWTDAANWPSSIWDTMTSGLGTDKNDVQAEVSPTLLADSQAKAARQPQQQALAAPQKSRIPSGAPMLDQQIKEYRTARAQSEKQRKQAEAMVKLANQERDDAARSVVARKQAEANRRTQRGETPYADAVKQRQALYNYLRGGGIA